MSGQTASPAIGSAFLEDLVAKLTPISPAQVHVVRQNVMDALRAKAEPAAAPGSTCIFGFVCFVKPGQVAAAWAFSDPKLARQYMDGEIHEHDLAAMAIATRQVVQPS